MQGLGDAFNTALSSVYNDNTRTAYGDAWNSGYDFGSGLSDKIGDMTSGLTDFMEGNAALYNGATGATGAGATGAGGGGRGV